MPEMSYIQAIFKETRNVLDIWQPPMNASFIDHHQSKPKPQRYQKLRCQPRPTVKSFHVSRTR
jgi:hypothetical protein